MSALLKTFAYETADAPVAGAVDAAVVRLIPAGPPTAATLSRHAKRRHRRMTSLAVTPATPLLLIR